MIISKYLIIFVTSFAISAYGDVFAQNNPAFTAPISKSVVIASTHKAPSSGPSNIGAQAAMYAAVGLVKQPKLGYVGAALVGLTTIMNNNDNDGRPATYTGGEGSNFAAGG